MGDLSIALGSQRDSPPPPPRPAVEGPRDRVRRSQPPAIVHIYYELLVDVRVYGMLAQAEITGRWWLHLHTCDVMSASSVFVYHLVTPRST